jgi:hypothetical protein
MPRPPETWCLERLQFDRLLSASDTARRNIRKFGGAMGLSRAYIFCMDLTVRPLFSRTPRTPYSRVSSDEASQKMADRRRPSISMYGMLLLPEMASTSSAFQEKWCDVRLLLHKLYITLVFYFGNILDINNEPSDIRSLSTSGTNPCMVNTTTYTRYPIILQTDVVLSQIRGTGLHSILY